MAGTAETYVAALAEPTSRATCTTILTHEKAPWSQPSAVGSLPRVDPLHPEGVERATCGPAAPAHRDSHSAEAFGLACGCP